MAGISVIILGVGRSGTTTLYKNLQGMMLSDLGGALDFAYEPFLWDRDVFNKPLDQVGDAFSRVSSLAIEGIYQHKKIPLLVSEASADTYCDHQFIANITTCRPGRDGFLSKMIRGNGRYRLIKKVSPEAKIIFMIRNPIDVINSSIAMFSFFGDDFYASDYDRFYKEALACYGNDVAKLPLDTRVQREALYWYVMNRHFLEASTNDPLVKKYVYEEYVRARNNNLKNIADFLGITADPTVLKSSSIIVGPSYGSVNLTQNEFNQLLPFMDLYCDLLKTSFIDVDFDKDAILDKYRGRFNSGRIEDPYDGLNGYFIRRQLRGQRSKNERVVEKGIKLKLMKYIKPFTDGKNSL